jgi:2'-5' RNA ligase
MSARTVTIESYLDRPSGAPPIIKTDDEPKIEQYLDPVAAPPIAAPPPKLDDYVEPPAVNVASIPETDWIPAAGTAAPPVRATEPSGDNKNNPDDADSEPAKHKFSTTQINLPPEMADAVRGYGAKTIAPHDLAEDGREADPHVTVKYGLHADNAEELRRLLADERPVTVKLGKTSIFPAKEGADYDVVKVDVQSPGLYCLNKKISDALPHTDTHPEYVPHATLAYVRPGRGRWYAGDDALEGQTATLNSIVFSDKNGEQVEVPLNGNQSADITGGAPQIETKETPSDRNRDITNYLERPSVTSRAVEDANFKAARRAMKSLRKRPLFDVWNKAGLFLPDLEDASLSFAEREEVLGSRVISHVPLVRRSERAFNTFLNTLRASVADELYRTHPGLSKDELKTIAEGLNIMSGSGSLGPLNKYAADAAQVIFAPRLLASRIQAPFLLASKSPVMRREAARNLTSFVAANLGSLGLAKMAGASVELDPRSTDFLRARFGDTRIDLSAGMQSPSVTRHSSYWANARTWTRARSRMRLAPSSLKTSVAHGLPHRSASRLIWRPARMSRAIPSH